MMAHVQNLPIKPTTTFLLRPARVLNVLLKHVAERANDRDDMLVNEAKTGLMCINAASTFEAKVEIDFNRTNVKTNVKDSRMHHRQRRFIQHLQKTALKDNGLEKTVLSIPHLIEVGIPTSLKLDPLRSRWDRPVWHSQLLQLRAKTSKGSRYKPSNISLQWVKRGKHAEIG